MKVIFLGTPSFASPVLEAILSSSHTVVAVVTQPDKVNARGNKVVPSPVKELAQEYGVPVCQYEKISRDGVEDLKALGADIMVTAAYGQILSAEVLNICRHGVINCHASILPKYRGSSPVQWALINGEKRIGVTVMQTALEVDSGDIILIKDIELTGSENAGECLDILSKLGGRAIVEALDLIESGRAVFTPQNHKEATHCRKLTKEDGKIDFNSDAESVINFIRGMTPWPSAFTDTQNGRLKILKASLYPKDLKGVPGEVVGSGKEGLIIKCGRGTILAVTVQGEGGKAMDSAAYLRGKPIAEGTVLR